MIIKIIAPGIIPGDWVTVNHMAGVPQRGDTVVIEVANSEGGHDEQLLTVKSVVWPVDVGRVKHVGCASLVEVVCDRAEDVGEPEITGLFDTDSLETICPECWECAEANAESPYGVVEIMAAYREQLAQCNDNEARKSAGVTERITTKHG